MNVTLITTLQAMNLMSGTNCCWYMQSQSFSMKSLNDTQLQGVKHRSTRWVLAYNAIQTLCFILANDTFNADQNNGICNIMHTNLDQYLRHLTTEQKEKQQERKHCNAITCRPSASCYTDLISEVRVTLHESIPSAVNAVMLSHSQ